MGRTPEPALLGAILAAACGGPAEATPPDAAADTGLLPTAPGDCAYLNDRPPGNGETWALAGATGPDVVAGVRPAATWNGSAALLHAGPQGDCHPCTLTGGSFGEARVASEFAVEIELGCDAEANIDELTAGWAGVRLHLTGPAQDLPDGTFGPLDLHDLPLLLARAPDGGARCVVDTSGFGQLTSPVVNEGRWLEPGRTLPYRIPVGPLVEAAGHDPEATYIGLYDVVLVVDAGIGTTAWIEVGRVLSDGCP